MRDKRVYSKEFKDQAVEMALQPEASKAGVARSLGITPTTLSGWISNYKKAQGILDPPKIEDEKSELVRLRRENRRLAMEIEILKKAAAYFAKDLL
jgi:transposase